VFEIQYIVIGLVQGITEFLPISSSGHLILISAFTEWNDQGIFTDIAVHVGTLGAVVMYLRKYIKNIIIDFFSFKKNYFTTNHLWGIKIIIATIPALVVGFIVYEYLIDYLRNIIVIAWSSIIFGIILYFADQRKTNKNIPKDLNIRSIIFIGLFQILALIPGVSRAGITMTAARFLNFNRVDSGKISFLLSIPALAGASFLGLKDLQNETLEINLLVIIAIVLSFLFSYITVKFFLNYLNKFSLNIFVIYRLIIALILLSIIYF